MRLHRFFIEEQLRNKKEITFHDDEIIHQWKDVFRLRAGDRVILLDNTGFEYMAELKLLTKGNAELKILDASVSENIPKKEIWLFASLIKKDHYEWILEKCTEIGVSHFIPIISERTEKKDLNIERAQKIIKEASEQSGRGIMPMLHNIVDLESAPSTNSGPISMPQYEENMNFLAFHGEGVTLTNEIREKILGRQSRLENSLGIPPEKKAFGIFIGPEGGWTTKEIEFFNSKNTPIYSLGKQVLRAETAAIAISALLLI